MVFLCAAFLSQAQTSPGDDKGAVAAIKTNLPYWGVGGILQPRRRVPAGTALDAGLGGGTQPLRREERRRILRPYDETLPGAPRVALLVLRVIPRAFPGASRTLIAYNFADLKVLDLENERRQGWGTGVGVSYGYQWLLHEHWNLEATLGVGYLYLNYDKFPCKNCGNKSEDNKKHYFGPTQAAVSLIYLF